MRGLGPSEIAWLDEQARVDSYGCRDDAWWRLTAAEVPRVAEIAGHDPHVLSMLASHPRGLVRAAAVEALSAINSGDEIPFLALRANDWVEPIAERAAALLAARLRPENRHAVIDALPFIVRMLGRRRRDHRRFAEATRSVLLSDDGQMLATRLSTFSPEVRRLAFRLVSSDITSLDHPLFTASSADDDAVIRRWTVHSLARYDDTEALVALLIDVLTRDRAPIVRKEALSVLAEHRPDRAIGVLPDALMDPSGRVRALAQFLALQRNLRPGPRDVYLERLTSSSPRLLVAAIEGLGDIGSREDFDAVRPFVDAAAPRVRRAALRAGVRLDSERTVSVAMEALSDDAPTVRSEALTVLTTNRHLVDFDVVRARLRTLTDPRARQNSLYLLREAAKWDAVVYLLEALGDSNPEVRRTASQLVDAWIRDFNQSQTAPAPQQLQHIRALLEATESNLTKRTAELLRFMLKPG